MSKGNPNGEDKKLSFVAKVLNPDYVNDPSSSAPMYVPLYIAPDATESVQGDVYLSDAIDGTENAFFGCTAATPAAVAEVNAKVEDTVSKSNPNAQTVAGAISFGGKVTSSKGFVGNLEGNADTATKLSNSRNITVKNNNISGTAAFDGSANVTINLSQLDATTLTGMVPLASIPKAALERMVSVPTQTARFALTEDDVQLGDTVQQLDTKVMYIVVDTSKLNEEAGYKAYSAGSAASLGTYTFNGNEIWTLQNGVPTKATSLNIGSASTPIYIENGVIKPCTALNGVVVSSTQPTDSSTVLWIKP